MKIKIGNFNFINNKEDNKVNFSSFYSFSDLFNYFYLDGKEDTLFVNSRFNFDQAEDPNKQNYNTYNFERNLLKKYYVIDYNNKISNEVNSFIKGKVLEIFNTKNYSRYDLYNNINFNNIFMLEQDSKYILLNSFESYINFENNKIIKDDIIYNPYLDKLENLEDLYKEGKFKNQIKAGLIKMEVENNIAPKFVTTIIKINNFMTDKNKKSVKIQFKDCEKSTINSHISSFLDIRNNKINLELGYNEARWFEKANPGKQEKDLKLDDIQGLSYSKDTLKINSNDFKELEKQIAITPEDKLLFKIDNLKEEVNTDYNNLMYDYQKKESNLGNINISYPYDIQKALNEITTIDIKNNQIKAGKLDEEFNSYPEWYSKDLENLFEKYDNIKKLENLDTIEDLKDIVTETGDNELQQIYYGFLNEEENSEEECEEDEL